MQRIIRAFALPILLIAFADFAHAQEAPAEAPDPTTEAVRAALQQGPVDIALRDQARLALPEGFGFIPAREAAQLLARMGNQTDERFVGLIVPLAEDASWMVVAEYEPSGYIKDDDAKDWNADELLQSLRDGTEAANAQREKVGVPAIAVSRWIEPPAYQADTHRLVWSAEARLKHGVDPDPSVNYNTYVLGREGYVSLNLVTSLSTIDDDKQVASTLLAAVAFNDGKRYTDFNSSTDKVAAYGLGALVAGVAAKKLGLLAALGVFLAKFGKVVFISLAAGGGVLAKIFKGRNTRSS